METVFISYCHKDEEWKDRLVTHLEVLEIEGFYQAWADRKIPPGSDWFPQIDSALNRARVVVMLISADYLVSKFINEVEIPRILERREKEGVIVVPVIVNSCAWQKVSWLSSIQVMPKDGVALAAMKPHEIERVLAEVAQTICDLIGGGGSRTAPTGFVSGAQVSLYKLPVTGERLFGREKELAQLDDAWADPHSRVVSLVAWGGVGKTALVNRWLNLLQVQDYRGALKVYGWSFYSQGAGEGKQASADEFFQESLAWFGDPLPGAGSAVDKGRRLARLAAGQKTLLILDGLEPLQFPPGNVKELAGKLKDPGLAAFLKELAVSQPGPAGNVVDLRMNDLNKSFLGVQGAIFQKSPLVAEGIKPTAAGPAGGCLCVITTRQSVADLAPRRGFAVKEIFLEHLPVEAGVELLKYLGVTTGSDQDFRLAVRAYDGHALALTLLGNYIKSVLKGDLRLRDEIRLLTEGQGREYLHAGRVMAAYEKFYTKYPKWKLLRRFKYFCRQGPELNILYLLGLFDRPVDPGAIAALRKEPAIPGVTDRLQQVSERDWQWALSHLREAGLVAGPGAHKTGAAAPDSGAAGSPGISRPIRPIESLDCHPLVREYFGAKLRLENPAGWQAAHERLYRYYKELGKERPDTLEEMEPLFAAVAHGCQAGLHQEALDEVYWKRIKRGNEHYCTSKLGAFGSDLACLSHFFEEPWGRPAAGLPEEKKALVLSWAAFRLRALGRLHEAVQPMKASLEMRVKQEAWKNAAMNASNLSELLLTLGEVKEAVAAARQCVSHADKSDNWEMKMIMRTTLADSLHQAGEYTEAEKWFREAEALQKQRQPEYRFLYSLQGFQFCDLLLGLGKIDEVRERAEKLFEWRLPSDSLLDISLDNLTMGRAGLLAAHAKKPSEKSAQSAQSAQNQSLSQAMSFLDQAVEGLRKSGYQYYLPLGLLARAEGFRFLKNYDRAREDINEALDIAELGGMKLYLCDYHLAAAKLCLDQGNNTGAADHARIAREIIDATGYHRRDEELKVIDL